MRYVRCFEELDRDAVPLAGGKGANLGEMVSAGFPVPPGFVVTADAYRAFITQARLRDGIASQIAEVDVDDRRSLENAAEAIQARIREAPLPDEIQEAIRVSYRELSRREGAENLLVAVRSSATMEDTAEASFAGMNRSFLNVRGDEELIQQVRVDGVGLLRAEFMLLSAFQGIHPRRLIEDGRADEFVQRMVEQLRMFARAFNPRPIIYRSTDFRTKEFRGLAGGEQFEPHEDNPMIGFRGAYRYIRDPALFKLELQILREVRQQFANLQLMIPFVRTVSELRACKRLVDEAGLTEQRDFQLWIMAEVPSVIYWLEEYAKLGIVGVSIGSNDLTQLMLGIDRDSEVLAPLFDERDHAVSEAIRAIVGECRRLGLRSSICGQAPSVYPDYAELLVRFGIDSISVNPDVIERTRYNIAVAKQRILLEGRR